MKKVLYGVALTLFAGVSVVSLPSCKDDLNDVTTQTSYDLKQLQSAVQDRMNDLQRQINDNKSDISDLYLKLNEYATLKYVNNLIYGADQANGEIGEGGLLGMINGALSRIGNVENILGIPDGYKDSGKNAIEYLDGKIGAQQQSIKEILDFLGYGDNLTAQEKTLKEVLEGLQTQLDALTNEERTGRVDVLEDKVNGIEELLTKMINQMNKQVTGILIQGVYSPVFGDLRLPLGIQSNILFNWYGKNERNKPITFPSKDFNANGVVDVDFPAGAPVELVADKESFYGDLLNQVTLGNVYVTLNPVGAEFDDLTVYLETSAGTRLPWAVTLEPSDYELTQGYSRSVENGFYAGKLVAPIAEAVEGDNAIAVEIEEGLKTSMKDALKNPSMSTAKSLVKAVYDQLSGKIPAYALRYDWYTSPLEVEGVENTGSSQKANAVLSKYDLAIATARPLGYNFLEGYTGSSKLPEIGHIQNLIDKIKEIGKFEFEFKPFVINGIIVDLGQITITNVGTDLKISLDGVGITNPDGSFTQVTPDEITIDGKESGMKDMLKEIQEAINSTLASSGSSVQGQINNMIGEIEKQVNDMMAELNNQVSGKINSVIDDFASKLEPYFGKIDKAIDLYNKIANKINNFLTNPNAYLQVAAFYDMGGNSYGVASGKASDPTPFVGDGEAFKLYLSSYTGELIVPACKKYVAITKAPAGADLAALNTGDLNKVLDGNKVEIKVAKPTVKGVYEFTYQALDFRGYTSTKKFYIEVK